MNELISIERRNLTPAKFQGLAEVPPELEWFANIDNEQTRRAYQEDVKEFSGFIGIAVSQQMRQITQAYVIAWRGQLKARDLAPATIRRKLSAISPLGHRDFDQGPLLGRRHLSIVDIFVWRPWFGSRRVPNKPT